MTIQSLLPAEPAIPRAGRPWAEHRKIINGMFWILCSGAPWRDLPERYEWSATALDGSNIRALKCAAGAQKNVPISPEITVWVALAVVLAPKSIWQQTEVVSR